MRHKHTQHYCGWVVRMTPLSCQIFFSSRNGGHSHPYVLRPVLNFLFSFFVFVGFLEIRFFKIVWILDFLLS